MDPHHCMRCGSFGRLRCRRCGFAVFCSKECQLASWQVHRRRCLPLNKMNLYKAVAEEGRHLKVQHRLSDEDQEVERCFICLDKGILGKNELYDPNCACRDSSFMHIPCLVQLVHSQYTGSKHENTSLSLGRCSTCHQARGGIIRMELNVALYELRDKEDDILTAPINEKIDVDRINLGLKNLDALLCEIPIDTAKYMRLKVLWRRLALLKHTVPLETIKKVAIQSEINSSLGHLMIELGSTDQGLDLLRESYRSLQVNSLPTIILYKQAAGTRLVVSLLRCFDASQNFSLLPEAEVIAREVIAFNDPSNLNVRTLVDRCQLAQVLYRQHKAQDAIQLLNAGLTDATRILGPSHSLTGMIRALKSDIEHNRPPSL